MRPIITLVAILLLAPQVALAQRLQLESLDRLAALASESVNLDIDPSMMKLALPFIKGPADEAQVKELLSSLKGIYVRVFEFDKSESYTNELAVVRKQLTNGSWGRLISIQDRQESVEVYSWREGEGSGGLAILVAEPREVVVVNVVGSIDLAKLGALQGHFGIPNLIKMTGAR